MGSFKVCAKVFHNKKNNQLVITLPRKQLGFLKGKAPSEVSLKVRRKDFKF